MDEFSNYLTPMDRDYGTPTSEDTTNDIGVGIKDIGWGLPLGFGAQNIEGIKAKIREGAGAIEIQFPGFGGPGNRQNQTPGMYGIEQREAIKELSKINEVSFTTHAGFMGGMGLAGMDSRSGNFSQEQRKTAVDEIKRAIEFAADAASGGSVVVHTGEYQRPIAAEAWAKDKDAPGGFLFKAHELEDEEAVVKMVDDRTGQVMQPIRKNEEVPRPVWKRAKDGHTHIATIDNPEKGYKAGEEIYVNANDYTDYEGNPVKRDQRVPEYDKEKGTFNVQNIGWKEFEEEAKEINTEKAEELGRPLTDDEMATPEEAFLKATLDSNEGSARGWALQYAQSFEKGKEALDELQGELQKYEEEEKIAGLASSHEEKNRLLDQAKRRFAQKYRRGLDLEEGKLPSDEIKKQIHDARINMEYAQQYSVSQQQVAEQAKDSKKHIKSLRKYALDNSFDSYAESGIYAYDQTTQKNLKDNPLFISMENIYPESYGAHPDELKDLVLKSRERMVKMITSKEINGHHNNMFRKGVSEQEAQNLAKTHIKATLDTGHLNTWRKYWQNDPGKTMTQNDADFQKWTIKKTTELAKEDIIGNVHLADNYGYHDEHLIPGQGNAPIKEIVKTLKEQGYKGALTVEAGAAATTEPSDFHGLMKTWRLFGSPVYGARSGGGGGAPGGGNWSNIQYSYFGQNAPPYFVFGSYSPSEEFRGSPMWSGVGLE